jgi:uncharacterized membrane protein YgaE (UPF0421/DUF939 family)
VYALEPSTPLSIQAEYVNAMWGSCVAVLCASLCFFSLGQLAVGCIVAIGFAWAVVFTIKAKKVFDANRKRLAAEGEGGEL